MRLLYQIGQLLHRNTPRVGEEAVAVFAAAANATLEGQSDPTIETAYRRLRDIISAAAPQDTAYLEADSNSSGRQLVLVEAIDRLSDENKRLLVTLTGELASRLRQKKLPTGLQRIPTWYTRVSASLIVLALFLGFGWIVDRFLSEEERHHLSEIQEEALATTYALTPLEVIRAFHRIFEEAPWAPNVPPLTPEQFAECSDPARAPYTFRGKECLQACYGSTYLNPADLRDITPLNRCRLGCSVHGAITFRGDPLVKCLSQCDLDAGNGADYRTELCFQRCSIELEKACADDNTRYYYANVSVLEGIVGRTLRSIVTTMRAKYFDSTIAIVITLLQLSFGTLMVIAILRFLPKIVQRYPWAGGLGDFLADDGSLMIWIIGFPYLMWFAVWIGINVFGLFLSAGGLITYVCTYGAGLKFFLEKFLDVQFHGPAERFAQNLSMRISKR